MSTQAAAHGIDSILVKLSCQSKQSLPARRLRACELQRRRHSVPCLSRFLPVRFLELRLLSQGLPFRMTVRFTFTGGLSGRTLGLTPATYQQASCWSHSPALTASHRLSGPGVFQHLSSRMVVMDMFSQEAEVSAGSGKQRCSRGNTKPPHGKRVYLKEARRHGAGVDHYLAHQCQPS